MDNLYVNTGWGTGGFKATPGSGWVYAHTIATGEPHELNAPFQLDRFTTGALVDEHGAAGGGPLMLVLTCPWCGPREEIEFRYGGEAGVAAPTPRWRGARTASPARRRRASCSSAPTRRAPSRERWHHSHGCRRWFSIRRSTVTHAFESKAEPIGRYRP